MIFSLHSANKLNCILCIQRLRTVQISTVSPLNSETARNIHTSARKVMSFLIFRENAWFHSLCSANKYTLCLRSANSTVSFCVVEWLCRMNESVQNNSESFLELLKGHCFKNLPRLTRSTTWKKDFLPIVFREYAEWDLKFKYLKRIRI